MNHKQKRRLATKMRTPDEAQRTDRKLHKGIFVTNAWERRNTVIAARVARKQKAAHERAVARKEAATDTKPSILTRAKRIVRAAAERRQKARRDRAAAYARKQELRLAQSV